MSDPAGLDAAIEAIAIDEGHPPECACPPGADVPCPEVLAELRMAAELLAPHVRRAALLEAADELNRFAVGEEVGVLRWLRERAERETA